MQPGWETINVREAAENHVQAFARALSTSGAEEPIPQNWEERQVLIN